MVPSPEAIYTSLLDDLSRVTSKETVAAMQRNPEMWPGMSYREAATLSIMKSLFKKFERRNNEKQDSVALEKFLLCNKYCRDWTLQLDSSWDEELYGEFKRAVYEFLNPDGLPISLHPYDLLENGRVGPGAAVGARGGDFYTKMFASKLTCTDPKLYRWYKRYVWSFPEWSNAELIRHAHYGEADVVVGNRLSFVPKNDKTSRSICVEPSLNMFYQLGLSSVIERRLLNRYGINLASQQSKNRELARLGSIDDSLATIDLESASDTIGWSMLREVLPREFYDSLALLRSPVTTLPSGERLELSMVSTMGNGFTFSLQTMLFSCLVHACSRFRGVRLSYPRGRDRGNFGVNGDDIVVPREIVADVYRLLKILGFTVNREKSFVEGPFRESCGADYFRGREIRGVYIKRLDSQQDRYSAINQLNLFSTKTGIQLTDTVNVLLKSVRFLAVPRWEDGSSGIHVPSSLAGPLPTNPETGSIMYYFYQAVGVKIRVLDGALVVPRGLKSRIYNPSGLYVSFLQRSVNSFSIGVRHDPPRWTRKRGVATNWDIKPPDLSTNTLTIHPTLGWFNWQRWETAVYMNLFK